MSEEKKQENQQPEPQKGDDLIDVDIFGTSVKLPVAEARKVIEKRDKSSASYKEISDKIKQYEVQKEELARKLEFETKAKSGAYAEAENIVAEKYKGKIDSYHKKIVETDIRSTLVAIPEFGGDETAQKDIIKLLQAEHRFELGEDGTIKSGDKELKDVVVEYVKARPHLHKNVKRSTIPENTKRTGLNNIGKQAPSIATGLAKFLKK